MAEQLKRKDEEQFAVGKQQKGCRKDTYFLVEDGLQCGHRTINSEYVEKIQTFLFVTCLDVLDTLKLAEFTPFRL